MTSLRTTVLACAAAAFAPAASATEVRIGADLSWVPDASYDAFMTDDGLGRLDIGLSYTVAEPWRLLIDVEAGYRYGGDLGANVPFASMTTELAMHEAYVGGRATFDIGLSWLRPYARAQIGALFGLASFRDDTGAWSFDDYAVAATVSGAGGLEVLVPSDVFVDEPPEMLTESFAFGLYVEGGYGYLSDLEFEPSRTPPDDPDVAADRIPAGGFVAGGLSLSGGLLRAGLVARF